VLKLIGSIIGALATIYAAGFSVVARKRWRTKRAAAALMDGLTWPWLVVRAGRKS
jgi:hypothetical protein